MTRMMAPEDRPVIEFFSGDSQVLARAVLSPVGTFAISHAAQARGLPDVRQRAPAGRLTVAIAPPGSESMNAQSTGLRPWLIAGRPTGLNSLPRFGLAHDRPVIEKAVCGKGAGVLE
jgi:hypothetical protein